MQHLYTLYNRKYRKRALDASNEGIFIYLPLSLSEALLLTPHPEQNASFLLILPEVPSIDVGGPWIQFCRRSQEQTATRSDSSSSDPRRSHPS